LKNALEDVWGTDDLQTLDTLLSAIDGKIVALDDVTADTKSDLTEVAQDTLIQTYQLEDTYALSMTNEQTTIKQRDATQWMK
jgi:hypothetical protein